MAKDKKLFSKVVMITFLVLVVIGFTFPAVLNSKVEQPVQKQPRLCQTDADCYLTCDGIPLATICSQNLCTQNDCDEYTLFPYKESPLTFTLDITLNGEDIGLQERIKQGDFFVTFQDQQVSVFSEGLPLNRILDKAGMIIDQGCLFVYENSFCTNLNFSVNGEEMLINGGYVPKQDDVVEIRYITDSLSEQ